MSRRRFLGASGALLAGAMAGGAESARAGRPNLLMVVVDDLGYGDLGCYGARDLLTPHIDRLAREGMRFSHFYANCPVCSPTRASLLTGRYPELVGVPGVIRTHRNNSWGHLSPQAVLLPSMLRAAGYHSAIIGKWHLGLQSPNIPNQRGFDYFHGFLGDMMDDYYTHRRHGINYMRRDEEEIDPKGHATDLFTNWAQEYLRSRVPGNPFFLYLAYNAPHTPIQPPAEWLERVQRRDPHLPEKRARIVALIEHLDDAIGRVMRTLAETGLADNTLLLFVSDNGGDLAAGASNDGTRAGKGTLYEGGIRVPMIARWPGRIPAGATRSRVALTMDLVPTLLEAAGVAPTHPLDGESILPTLLGREQPQAARDLFWGRREGGGIFGSGGTIEGMRRGDWKLLRSRPGGPWELYHLADDPLEEIDRAVDQPEKVRELEAALEAQLRRYRQVPWQPPA
ncbi:MAG: sulfatase-like hydrolase/transferase [Armatimonadota bacterium]|nr:sulfatase-like hydrolase/transferase [Armatimonadota bacterium]